MNEPVWTQEEAVLAMHQRQLAEHGGIDGVRDPGLLSSVLARLRHVFAYATEQTDVAHLAAAYAFSIARNHPFLDGYKRTAAVVCKTFLEINKHLLTASDEHMYTTFLQLAEGSITEEELAAWIRKHLGKI